MSVSLGDVAGLIGALVFLLLVGFLALPLIRLSQVFDEARIAVKEMTEHTLPVIDEAATTIATTNVQLAKVDQMTTSAAEITQNVSALTALVSATVGGPLIKVAAFSYGVRRAMSDLAAKVRR
ncbi:DUF948 domain-containing protein [Actinotalea sp. M2MS4P-6]|uniref:DUF948 domain-containing protein n=1 Tax=Actinotalea sp. M2MS4P-6 TaxID=2983762 RepID=UPI0021E4725C|nr:DUF948 domain-containing protein [Actinotalea sp. M2MS4P-6]MCV2394565.1 DUF948 domain-containing protein [Actinotalea sp. M2MS4P-6]